MNTMKHNMAKRIWLDYFNRTLFEAGLITERERNLLYHKINQNYQPKPGGYCRKSGPTPKQTSQAADIAPY